MFPMDHREGLLMLGIVDIDLYVPDLSFVFRLTHRSSQETAIALPRLRQESHNLPEDERLFLAHAVKEAIHELGHTSGLGHCNNRSCVMAFSNSLSDTDYKEQAFCRQCRVLIRAAKDVPRQQEWPEAR
jgi:archaemetzincin